MLLKFQKPIPIHEARQLYNDSVKFITTTESYPNVDSIEFDSDPRHIFKRKHIDPKINIKSDRLISKYESKLTRVWNRSFKSILEIAQNPNKQESVVVTDDQKQLVKKVLDQMKEDLSDTASKPFEDAFKLGKLRGQVISNQEIDDDLNENDDAAISDQLDDNEQYLAAFSDDLQNDLDSVMASPYETYEDLASAIKDKVQKPKKSRLMMYAQKVLFLIAAGMIASMHEAKPEEGHLKPSGGYWTLHPEEGLGREVCQGCEENAGKFFTLDEFQDEYHTNDCLTRCRCTLEFRENE